MSCLSLRSLALRGAELVCLVRERVTILLSLGASGVQTSTVVGDLGLELGIRVCKMYQQVEDERGRRTEDEPFNSFAVERIWTAFSWTRLRCRLRVSTCAMI